MEMVRSGEAGSGVNAEILVALSNILLAEGQPSVGYGIENMELLPGSRGHHMGSKWSQV